MYRVGRSKIFDLDYFEEFKRLLNKIELEEKLVFIIDEFSEVVENIINVMGKDAARKFLHQNRELRHAGTVIKKIQFIYCGSIGMGNLAESIDAAKIINDLTDFPIPPLSNEEAVSMIDQLTINPELNFSPEIKDYLIDKVHWLMPYYIQAILSEMETIIIESGGLPDITSDIIDSAIDEALAKRTYIEHWHVRLNKAFKDKNYDFANQVLNAAADSEAGVSRTRIFDMGVKLEIKEESSRRILRTLEDDGYISRNEDRNYSFNSPLLKTWWERNILV